MVEKVTHVLHSGAGLAVVADAETEAVDALA